MLRIWCVRANDTRDGPSGGTGTARCPTGTVARGTNRGDRRHRRGGCDSAVAGPGCRPGEPARYLCVAVPGVGLSRFDGHPPATWSAGPSPAIYAPTCPPRPCPTPSDHDARPARWRSIATGAARADSSGRRNTLIEGCVMGRPVGWTTMVTGRPAMRSPGRPLKAQGKGGWEISRAVGRDASTISRELRRNAATRGGRMDYRAVACRASQSTPEGRQAGRKRSAA